MESSLRPLSTPYLALVTLSLFLTVGPFIQGYFFDLQYLPVVAALYLLVLIDLVRGNKRLSDRSLFSARADYGFALLLSLGTLYLVAASKQHFSADAVYEALKIAALIPLYYFATKIKQREHALTVLKWWITGLSLATLVGIGFSLFRNQRYEGLLEYANSSALLLLVGLAINIALGATDSRFRRLCVSHLFTVGLLLTQSRTVFLLFFLLLLLIGVLLIKWRHNRTTTVLGYKHLLAVFSGVLCALCYPLSPTWFVLGSAVSLLLLRFMQSLQPTILRNLVFTLLSFAAVGFLLLPTLFFDRLRNLSIERVFSDARFGYYTDSLPMIFQSPWLGYGGGGWSYLQFYYQNADYFVKYIHNHLLQIWLDSGVFALLAWIIFFVLAGLNIARALRTCTIEQLIFPLAAMFSLIAMWLHSIADFSFSYLLISGLFVIIAGFHDVYTEQPGYSQTKAKQRPLAQSFLKWVTVVTAGLMMTASTLFALSIVFHGWAEIQWRQQHFDQATSAAKLSLTLNPFSPRTHATLGKIIWSQSTDRENLELALQSVNNAVRFQPENIQLLLMKSQLLVSLGRTQEAVQLLEKTTARAPFRGEVRSELKRLTQTPAPD